MYTEIVIMNGRTKGQTVGLPDNTQIVIGRDKGADFPVNHKEISRKHCLIENNNNGILLTDLKSTNGSYLNGVRITSSYLKHNDSIVLGKIKFKIYVMGESRDGKTKRRHSSRDQSQPSGTIRFDDLKQTNVLNTSCKIPNAPDQKRNTSVNKDDTANIKSYPAHQIEAIEALDNLQTLYKVSSTLAKEDKLDVISNCLVDEVLKAVPADRVGVLTRNKKQGTLEPIIVRSKKQNSKSHEITVSQSVVDNVFSTGIATLSSDACSDKRYKAKESIRVQHIRSIICVPIMGKTRMWGVIYTDTLAQTHAFGKTHLDLLSSIGQQAGIAFDRAHFVEDLENQFIATIRTLGAAVDAKDPYTHGHSARVTEYALGLGDLVGIKSHERDILELAGFLHDIGKIGTPEAILCKPAKLDKKEYASIKRHPSMGADIILNIKHPFMKEVARAVRAHHECWDGSGYPDGLAETDICLMARILSIADTFDAMTSTRPYRQGMSRQEALKRIQNAAGKQFDPQLVTAFCRDTTSSFFGTIRKKTKYSLTIDPSNKQQVTIEQDIPLAGLREVTAVVPRPVEINDAEDACT